MDGTGLNLSVAPIPDALGAASAGLLKGRFDHPTRPAFAARAHRQAGMGVTRENCPYLNRAINDAGGHRRALMRITRDGQIPEAT